MNNTTKAKYDLAEKMLKGRIPVSEVVLMTGISEKEIQKMADELEDKNPEAKVFKNLDFTDFNMKEVLFDDTIAPDELANMPDAADINDITVTTSKDEE